MYYGTMSVEVPYGKEFSRQSRIGLREFCKSLLSYSIYQLLGQTEAKKYIDILRLARNMGKILAERRYLDESQVGDTRSPFQHDKDRILHSTAFRRMQYKTQVYVIHESDLYRTRMTHSLEVAQIARGLAQQLGANMDLAEAIALAHDVGHAPFGHAGESKLRKLLKPFGLTFEHNVQSYRVVTQLEERYASYPGLNLTRATREGIIRHQSYFDNQEDILKSIPENIREEIAEYLPPSLKQPGLEAQIVNIADIIAYATHDIEDALTVGLINWDRFEKQVEKLEINFLKQIIGTYLDAEMKKLTLRMSEPSPEIINKMKIRILSHLIINHLIIQTGQQTKKNLDSVGGNNNTLCYAIREQDQYVVAFPPVLEKQVERLVNDLLYNQVYSDPRVKLMTVKAERILDALFDNFMQHPDIMPRITQTRLNIDYTLSLEKRNNNEQTLLAQVVADYISGMTDKYAMDTYQLLTQAYEKAL